MPKYFLVSCRDRITEVEGVSFVDNVFKWEVPKPGPIPSDLNLESFDLDVTRLARLHPLMAGAQYNGPEGQLNYVTGVFETREEAVVHARENLNSQLDIALEYLDEDFARNSFLKSKEIKIANMEKQIRALSEDIDSIKLASVEPNVIEYMSYYTRRRDKLLERLAVLDGAVGDTSTD